MSAATWPELSSNHALLRLHSRLATILKEAEHDQIWQVTLSSASPPAFSTLLVLQKYLRSTSNDVDKAAEALTKTLKWRKDFGLDKGAPLSDANAPEFDGLGFVTVIGEGETKKVVTWNVYGSAAAKGLDKVFGDLEKFLKWRVNLMEQGIAKLNITNGTTPIPDFGEAGADPYTIDQVHDYLDVSFLRMDPNVKSASSATIKLMQDNYPELLHRKYFVSVPYVMSWVFTALKLFVKKETTAKFVVLSWKSNLAKELGTTVNVPVEYGGTGAPLSADTVADVAGTKETDVESPAKTV